MAYIDGALELGATEQDKVLGFAKVNPLKNVESFLINKGETPLQLDFDFYDTHICMSYEYSNIKALEPEEEILIAFSEENNNDI